MLGHLQILVVDGFVAHLLRDDVLHVSAPAELHQRELQAPALPHHVWVPGVVVVHAREEALGVAVRQDRLLAALASKDHNKRLPAGVLDSDKHKQKERSNSPVAQIVHELHAVQVNVGLILADLAHSKNNSNYQHTGAQYGAGVRRPTSRANSSDCTTSRASCSFVSISCASTARHYGKERNI